MGRSVHLGPLAHRDHKESRVSKVKLVFLVPLVLLGWTVLGALLGVTVGKAIKEHLDPSDPEDLPEYRDQSVHLERMDLHQWVPLDQRESQVRLGPKDHQALSDPQARHPQN